MKRFLVCALIACGGGMHTDDDATNNEQLG